MKIEIHPEAVAEARAAYIWYSERSTQAAESFLVELDKAFEIVVETPEIRPLYIGQTRRYFFPHFPFAVVYRVRGGLIQVIAVAHGRRKPGYWRNRNFA